MRTVLIAVTLAGLANMAAAALPDVDIQPTGSNGEINGGRVVLSWGFGAGAPLVTSANIAAGERAEGIAGGATTQDSGVVAHFKNNWGKWLSGLATVAGYVLVADNNDFWPFTGGGGESAGSVSGDTVVASEEATSAAGGTAINGSDNVVVNNNGGTVNVYQDSPIANEK